VSAFLERALRLASIAALGGLYFVPPLLGGSILVYNTLVVIALFAVMAYGMDIILSDLGEVSLAHTVFFAAGAYTAGLLATRSGLGAWATLGAALVVSTILAVALGLLTLRVREFVFSLVTYAASVVCLTIAHNWSFLGGSDGIVGIPPLDLSIGGLKLVAVSNKDLWPYAYALLLVVLYFVARFRRSRLGHAALMVHMNPRLAAMSGIDGQKIRLRVFVLSAPITAAGGWLYAYQRAYVGPDLFETYFLVLMLTAVVVTGRRLLLGPLIGTALLMTQKSFFSLGAYTDKIVLGTILIVTLSFFPAGIVGAFELVRRRRAPRHGAAGIPQDRPRPL
jgi:branched-chain amino acid transport system permease protein